ncbi:MAG: flippase-like domain-containing protein [Alphaproteobacteria bacterium]|nr:flippase-like domain-containing protein [Alphaproteobacteria bacterium]
MKNPDAHTPALRRALLGAVGLLLVMLLTLFALSRSLPEAERLGELAARTDPLSLLAAMAVMTLGMVFMAMRWRALIPGGEGLPALGLTAIVCAGLLLNYALPGPVGELAVAFLVRQRYGLPVAPALAAGIHSRFVGLGVAGVLAGLIWATGSLPVPPDYEGLIGFTAMAIAVGAAGLGLLSARPRLLRAISHHSVGAAARRLPGRIGGALAKLDEAIAQVADSMGQVGRLGPGPTAARSSGRSAGTSRSPAASPWAQPPWA